MIFLSRADMAANVVGAENASTLGSVHTRHVAHAYACVRACAYVCARTCVHV